MSFAETYTAEGIGSVKWDIGLHRFHLVTRGAWTERLTGEGVRIGIIDTGVDARHPDLRGQVVAWRDFTGAAHEPFDDDTHGTHVAGIIAGTGHWQTRPAFHYFPFGMTGVAPGAKLLIAKAMDSSGGGDPEDVAQAIEWLVDPNGDGDLSDGADVINLSIGVESAANPGNSLLFGRSEPTLARVRSAIAQAVSQGVVMVVAAGNHEPGANDFITFPGTMDSVITVGATDVHGRVTGFSNRGAEGSEKPDLVAPGVILSTFQRSQDVSDGIPDGYLGMGGTSMAAPLVTGVIALAMEALPELRGKDPDGGLEIKAARIRAALLSSTDRDGLGAGWDPAYGHGRFDANAFLDEMDAGQGPLSLTFFAAALALALALYGLRRLHERRDERRWNALRAQRLARISTAGLHIVAPESAVGPVAGGGALSAATPSRSPVPAPSRARAGRSAEPSQRDRVASSGLRADAWPRSPNGTPSNAQAGTPVPPVPAPAADLPVATLRPGPPEAPAAGRRIAVRAERRDDGAPPGAER